MPLPNILQYIGAATALAFTYKTVSFLWLYLRPSSLPRYHHGKPGTSWALVTGSTMGIGEAFAHALSSKGFNLLLHGRSQEKLDKIKSTILSKNPNIKLQTVIADAFDINSDIAGIVKAAESLPGKLTILINNVGGVPFDTFPATVGKADQSHIDKLLNLNARFPTQLTRALLPLLGSNTPSLILNIGSITGLRGMPYLTTYSASKAFNIIFSQALSSELKGEKLDIEVLGIVVGNTLSGTNKNDMKGFTCSAERMAEESLNRVGCGRSVTFGWWRHELQIAMFTLLPDWLVEGQYITIMKDMMMKGEKNA